ncbi:hypothetical protein [Streptomyces litchfieldiae]|uniref:Uncharacterized protein n=1 Tax=Streptomyces litchfieldiae TaxID=3075543 RepID=A0ABU2MX20_9ACTN|nr:hypothetical protein [Streptomyces sp. DSM 44938]MDT0346155.1 hypothetical protein [Streptomyces sp. DSM 44938]
MRPRPVTRAAAATAVTAAALLGAAGPASASSGPECPDWSAESEKPAELPDMPDTMVAGEWSEFTFRVVNDFGEPVDSLHTFLRLETNSDVNAAPELVPEIQWRPDGEWLDIGDPAGFFADAGPLEPDAYAEVPVRVRLPADTLHEAEWFIDSGVFVNRDGSCQLSDWSTYDVDFVAPGTDIGPPRPAEGAQVLGNSQAPEGDYPPLPAGGTGPFAASGGDSSSAGPPVYAVAGVTTLAIGGGTAFLLHRRRGTRA